MKLKQNRFPVLYLLEFETDYSPFLYFYPNISEVSLGFANSERILGVDMQASDLLKDIQPLRHAQELGLVTFVWGDDLATHENRDYFKNLGVEGVIYDRWDCCAGLFTFEGVCCGFFQPWKLGLV